MNEYITKEVALDAISYAETWSEAFRLINSQKAADVVEVRHGRWIADKSDVEWGNYLIRYRCSECKERPHFDKDKYKFILSHYCPNCGAKMDGGQDE